MATVRILRSTTAAATPSSLVSGQIAINEADGKLYYRNSAGTVTSFAPPAATSSTLGTVIVGSGLSVSSGTISANLTSSTTGITGANAVTNIVYLTSAAYTALSSKSASTLYIISG